MRTAITLVLEISTACDDYYYIGHQRAGPLALSVLWSIHRSMQLCPYLLILVSSKQRADRR